MSKPRAFGLRESGRASHTWSYRDPMFPWRKAFIREEISRQGEPRTPRKFEVWLSTKRGRIKHYITGDLLDACALAAAIIHAPPGSPYRSAPKAHELVQKWRNEYPQIHKFWKIEGESK